MGHRRSKKWYSVWFNGMGVGVVGMGMGMGTGMHKGMGISIWRVPLHLDQAAVLVQGWQALDSRLLGLAEQLPTSRIF